MVRHYYVAKGVQLNFSEGRGGNGAGVPPHIARKLEEELTRIEPPLQRLSRNGFSALRTLCVHERSITEADEGSAIICLLELGQLLRKTWRR
jgi:hypothetical protein